MTWTEKILNFLKKEHSYLSGLGMAVILGFLLELTGLWYLMLLAGGVAGFFIKKPAPLSFLVGFCGIAIVWFCFFVYFMTIGPLSEFLVLITSILGFLESSPGILILITIIIGGILGGLGAWNGTYFASLIYSRETSTETKDIKDLTLKS
ncbi:MAG TPA: hypothetical protein VMV49_14495 [Candidatus Deferrimicrobium sp.]|nr:hypothetical protein [Candidatus Deferrimicrobium sp.]